MAVDVVRFQSNEREKISDCGTPRLNFLVFFVEVYRQARFTFAILLGRHEVERSEGLLSLPGRASFTRLSAVETQIKHLCFFVTIKDIG